jgi:RNA polymerase sigma-70 factor (ECF subfamily)
MSGGQERARTVFEAFCGRHRQAWFEYALRHTADGGAAQQIVDHTIRLLGEQWIHALSQESVEAYAWALFKDQLSAWLTDRDRSGEGFVRAAAFERASLALEWVGEFTIVEYRMWFYRAIHALPERQHDGIVLHYMLGLSVERTAETQGIAITTARSNIRHARTALKQQAGARHLLRTSENGT